MSWFRRVKDNILTKTEDKNNTPDGLWAKCPNCKKTLQTKALKRNAFVCEHCDHHLRVGSEEYFDILFDGDSYEEMEDVLVSGNPLEFTDTKAYPDRLAQSFQKTGLKDALRVARGEVNGLPFVICAMDFRFIGGSMGGVVGEKIKRGIDYCVEHDMPLLVISKSGGARMMEGALSLMQMAKVSANLTRMAQKQLSLYIATYGPYHRWRHG